MPKVKFGYDLKKDAWWWVETAKGKKDLNHQYWKEETKSFPPKLLKKVLVANRKNAESAMILYLKKQYKTKWGNAIKNSLESVKRTWPEFEDKFFTKLEKLHSKPIHTKNFNCSMTTMFRCPYDERDNSFMISFWHSLPMQLMVICHEIMHLHFLHYYKKYLEKQGLDKDQIHLLKESLTFLLNEPEFEDIMLVEDKGYPVPKHQKLRAQLQKIWQKKRNFKKFLEIAIKTKK